MIKISNKQNDDENRCTICKQEDNIETESKLTIVGGVNCHYCGNQINLCAHHARMLKQELYHSEI